MCLVNLEKAFDRVPIKVLELALRKKRILGVLIRLVMRMYEEVKKRVRKDSELSEEFDINVGMHQGSVMLPFCPAVVVDDVTEFT